ncbi:efflux transporter periplasmic adaptor subunit [Brasilonema octagenarum UFV-E1]|uniref:Efflux transporter periplasmic adaptor subunit n=1 Tax=Brasilonema sennae CENA114 TaxID=415709 RepID=A0A856MEL1_9CYAN|nr:efflux RND transporter periplasmic adaptor subunit [Brasilonema sennae]QDL09765.1 efflux transporter periplasmic adaptor subunit [Brasilonema sennae CENA114]QDL16119.1 efflux transporter periplasmic adaptor subunit [Brasilonema octagenarum UFV-E1]
MPTLKTFKSGVQWLAWSGVLALVSTGGWLVYIQTRNRPAESVALPVVTVERGNIETTINESGTLELRGQQTLKSPAEGAVEQVLVRLGDQVKSGQPLIILRNPDRQTILANQQLQIQKQELTLARNRQKVVEAEEKLKVAKQENQTNKQLQIQKQELTVARNRQKVVEAEEQLKAEEKKLQELEALDQRGFIPKNELRTQEEQVRRAKTALWEAKLTVSSDTIELQNLQLEIQNTQQQTRDKIMQAESAVQDAQLAVNNDTREFQRLQLELQKIQQQLQNNVVTAPINGNVLDIKVKDGEGVQVRTDLLTLGDSTQELVSLQLSTLNAAKVRVNQSARISVIGPNAQTFEGRVQSLSPIATTSSGNESQSSSQQAGQATVSAKVRLNTPSRKLIPGSQVNVEIVLQQRQNVVVLDTEAIQRSEEKPFVLVRDKQGKAQKKNITLGLEGLTNVEVTSGLRPGDQVVLPAADSKSEPGTPTVPEDNSTEGNSE